MVRSLPRLLPFVLLVAGSACGGPSETGRGDGPLRTPVPPPAPAQLDPADLEPPPPFTLTAGDLVDVRVFGHPELTLSFRVPQEGKIRYPLLGDVVAAGRSPKDLEKHITDALAKDYLSEPQVSVNLTQAVPRRVYVMGAVRMPREYEIPADGRLTLLQAVGLAGGMTDDASRAEVMIERIQGDKRRRIKVPWAGPERAGIFLRPGDAVIVPDMARAIYVLGAVNQPGSLRLPPSAKLTVVGAVSMAGGFTKFAASSRVQVTRAGGVEGGSVSFIDVDAILDGQTDLDVELQAGDMIFVPQRLF